MKKFRLRKWVEYLLVVVAFLSFCVMGSECDDTMIFIVSHLIATITFGISLTIISEYGR